MATTRLCAFSHRHIVWLLWLVLLLPMGQTAATWHVLSHTDSGQTDSDDGKQGVHQDHCDLCFSAATLIGGAPLVASSGSSLAEGRVEAPLLELHGILPTAPTLAYNSRAPPISLL